MSAHLKLHYVNVKNTAYKALDKLSISKENKQKIVKLANQVANYVWDNKSYLLFGSTVLFTLFMAPASSFSYLSQFGSSSTSLYIEGFITAGSLLALGNVFGLRGIAKKNDDRINYIMAGVNICEVCLSPFQALISNIFTSGMMFAKFTYRYLFPISQEKNIKVLPVIVRTKL